MSRPKPSLTDFRRIVVKVGSSLLVDSQGRPAGRGMARVACAGHCAVAQGAAATCSSSPRARSRSAAPCSGCRPARSSSRTARPPPPWARFARANLVGGARPARHHRRPSAGHTARYRRAPALSQCPLHIGKLLEWRASRVINENDTVATSEIRYGDNDRLAARVATMASADLLVLLSDVEASICAARCKPRRQFVPRGGAHHAGNRGNGGRGRIDCRAGAC